MYIWLQFQPFPIWRNQHLHLYKPFRTPQHDAATAVLHCGVCQTKCLIWWLKSNIFALFNQRTCFQLTSWDGNKLFYF